VEEDKRRRPIELGVAALAGLALIIVFTLAPIPGGDDWEIFHGAAQRILKGVPLYGEKVTHGYYYNPPWLAVLFAPLGGLPFRLGWAILSVVSLVGVAAVVRRWGGSLIATILVLLSPAMIYTLLHGQIDGLVLSGVLLPQEWWILVAVTKPQIAIGLLLGIPRAKLLRALLVSGLVLLVSFLLFGNWPLQAYRQPRTFQDQTHNLWLGLWPFQVPAGIALLLLGMSRRDERWLIAGSPFLLPYAATSSLLGPWAVLCTVLTEWQALIVLASWWGAVVYRMLF
jgi:hypothetical protein